MLTYKEFLRENFTEVTKEPSSYAAKEAKKLGLEYYGFGRYGKSNKVSHVVVSSQLKPVAQRPLKTDKHEKVVQHAKGLASDGKLAELKKKNPEGYKKAASVAQERLKVAQARQKEQIAASTQVDKANQEYAKFFTDKRKEIEKTHETLATKYDWRGLSNDEKVMLSAFSGQSHQVINKALKDPDFINGKIELNVSSGKYQTFKLKDVVDHLDNAIAKTAAPSDFYTYAGIKGFKPPKDGIIGFPGYRSSTIQMSTAMRFARDKHNLKEPSHVVQIKVKKGQQGMYMDGNYTGAGTPGEREFMLPRDTHLKLIDKPKKIVDPDGHVLNVYQAEIIDDPDLYS